MKIMILEIYEHFQKPVLKFWIFQKVFFENTKNALIFTMLVG